MYTQQEAVSAWLCLISVTIKVRGANLIIKGFPTAGCKTCGKWVNYEGAKCIDGVCE